MTEPVNPAVNRAKPVEKSDGRSEVKDVHIESK